MQDLCSRKEIGTIHILMFPNIEIYQGEAKWYQINLKSRHESCIVSNFAKNEKKYMNVEVQFRTIAMDFWASVEHKMKYKREINNAEIIVEELRYSADLINQLDRRMLQIRERIEKSEVPSDD